MKDKQNTRLAKPSRGHHARFHGKDHLASVNGILDFCRGHFRKGARWEVVAVIRGHLIDSDHDGGEGELCGELSAYLHLRMAAQDVQDTYSSKDHQPVVDAQFPRRGPDHSSRDPVRPSAMPLTTTHQTQRRRSNGDLQACCNEQQSHRVQCPCFNG
jgi:hypothetical protein